MTHVLSVNRELLERPYVSGAGISLLHIKQARIGDSTPGCSLLCVIVDKAMQSGVKQLFVGQPDPVVWVIVTHVLLVIVGVVVVSVVDGGGGCVTVEQSRLVE